MTSTYRPRRCKSRARKTAQKKYPHLFPKVKLFAGHSSIKALVAKISEVDVSGVDPLVRPAEISNVFREDVVKEGLTREAALKNAPEHDGEFFIVPKIVGREQ